MTRYLIILAVLSSCEFALGQFRDEEDQKIATEVVNDFRQGCAQKTAVDGQTLIRIKDMERLARQEKVADVAKCFRENMSQISGVYYLHEKLCSSVTSVGPSLNSNSLARQLLNALRYEAGIRPFQARLNNCLMEIPLGVGRPYIVMPVATLSATAMLQAIESITLRDPYPATQRPFR